ncbi:MAG: AraC family ligand binding domain-containing protein, partial [Clostridia bacterium]|nr:AraC family ligand binding domain-containing protein [Clostridia bacterium]
METVKFHFDNVFYDEPKVFAPYRIYQVGDIDTYSGFKCKPHCQIADEITYIVSGNANMLCGDKTYLCHTGDVIFNPKGTMHAIDSADGQSLRYYYITFDIHDITLGTEKKLFELLQKQKSGFAHADRSISHTFHDIFLNINSSDEFSDVIISDSIRKLLMYTLRSLNGRANNIYMPDMRFGKKRTVAQICSFIDDNVEDIGLLKKLPEKFGYSY